MGYEKDQRPRNIPKVKLRGAVETINSQSITVLQEDDEGKIILATGTAAASTQDGQSRYAKGALYIDTDVAGGTSGTYQNVGTTSSSSFQLLGSGDVESVAASHGLLGGGLSGALTLSHGVQIYNDSGGDLNPGTLVAITGFDTTNGLTISLADVATGIIATHVVVDSIADATTGNIYPVATVTGLNTDGQTIGDLVYLDSASPGGFAFVPNIAGSFHNQIIGVVKVVDLSAGEIVFIPGIRSTELIGTNLLQNEAVDETKVANLNGIAGLAVKKYAQVVYDFSVDGGSQGAISLTGAPTIPDNAVVNVDSYDVVTTLTSATDAATVSLQLPTDGELFTAIAINDASNPWDQGVAINGLGALVAPTPKKCTDARVPQLVVAGGEDLTAGKIQFNISYWVSE